ncbi:MAG: lipid II flippase Amj family protein [Clostridia bacterium]|nr:lipid II flippase Amj family protein [Clostridia bacterium]
MKYINNLFSVSYISLGMLIVLTIIIHMIDTLAYSVRLNAVKSGQFALSFSLFNIIVLVSRTANMLQGPLIGSMIDKSILNGTDPISDIRNVIFAATIGTIFGIILIPTFINIFSKAVLKLGSTGSMPTIVLQSLSVDNIKRIAKNVSRPSKQMLRGLRYRDIPKRLMFFSILITGVYTIGVLAANYSAIFVSPEHRLTAVGSSGIINGLASILLTLIVDPKAAIITDEVYRGKRKYGDIKALVIMLIASKLLGTLLGQLLIVPGAKLISIIYNT